DVPCLGSSRTGLHTEVRLQLCLSRRPQRTRIARAHAYRGLADAGRARRLRGTNHHHRADRPTPTRLRGRYVEAEIGVQEVRTFLGTLSSSAIWIPYFLRSKRSARDVYEGLIERRFLIDTRPRQLL